MRREMFRLILAATAGTGWAAPALSQDAPGFCEAGFVLADEDGDGILALTEVEAMSASEFAAFDADASASVTAEEYTACLEQATSGEIAPRNVSLTGSGELEGSGVRVELEGLADGRLTRQEYMEAAQHAYDGAGNEEDNQLEWARAFIHLGPEESEIDVRTLSRDEYAARALLLFRRLDGDGDGALTPEEWVGEAIDGSGLAASFEAEFRGLDADASGDVTLVEYSSAGAERASRAREAALAGGWGERGEQAGGIGEVEGEVVATESEGLAGEDGEAATAADPAAEPAAAAQAEGGETAAEDQAGQEGSEGAAGSVPVFQYRFGLGG